MQSTISIGAVTTMIAILSVCGAAVVFLICVFSGFCKESAKKQFVLILPNDDPRASFSLIGKEWLPLERRSYRGFGERDNVIPIAARRQSASSLAAKTHVAAR